MTTFLKLLPALALACTCNLAHAQQAVTMEEGHLPKKGKTLESRGQEAGLVMQGGKMMRVQDGKMTPMTEAMTMNNGTKVMADGKVKMADGQMLLLHNGQMVLLDGRVLDRSQNGKSPK